MVKRLDTVRFAGKKWFIDLRLEEYRNVKNPHEKITFQDAWRRF
jgi:hypothetical protein